MLTNDGRYSCEIKSRIDIAKAAFNKKKTLFTSKCNVHVVMPGKTEGMLKLLGADGTVVQLTLKKFGGRM
jgi:hypothetical protein